MLYRLLLEKSLHQLPTQCQQCYRVDPGGLKKKSIVIVMELDGCKQCQYIEIESIVTLKLKLYTSG